MKKNVTTILIISLLTILVFSGCTETEKTNTNDNNVNNNDYLDQEIGIIETFSVNSSGGDFSLFDDKVKMNIGSQALENQTDITVETIENPVDDDSIIMFSCFEFGPDGTTFNTPVDLIIRYDEDNLPEGVNESDVKIYVLNDTKWEVIEDSFANQAMHWSVASVSHFSKMGGGAPAPSTSNNDDSGNNGDTNGENGSSQYWFKANLEYYNYNIRGPSCHPDKADDNFRTEYNSGLCAWWDPVSYVQYYEVKFVFNDNPPKDTATCEFRDWGESWCPLGPLNFPKAGYIYHLGGDPSIEGYIGTFDTRDKATCSYLDGDVMKSYVIHQFWPEGKHGFPVFGIHDYVRDDEELPDYEYTNLASTMESYVLDYTEGWEVWVRGVTETMG
jgi:hypothetical protein